MDQVVYDMSTSSAEAPSVFLRKDWVSIMDNNNGVYTSNTCTIDTSALSNSNRYMSWRESYLSIPLLLSVSASADPAFNTAATSGDYAFGLKNSYASVIHSIQVDLQGSTCIQQTSFINIWNCFRLLTTLSWQDVATLGPSIGFYPDTSTSFEWFAAAGLSGMGVCNNLNYAAQPVVSGAFNAQDSWNRGFYERQRMINFDPAALSGVGAGAFTTLISVANIRNIYKSYIQTRLSGAVNVNALQFCIMANVMLRHLHPFFDKMVLSKGVFMKIQLVLNNATVSVPIAVGATLGIPQVSVPSGGLNPIMIASAQVSNGSVTLATATYGVSLSIGNKVLGSVNGTAAQAGGTLGASIMLNVPSIVFNPQFESAYLSSPVKNIEYSDVYFYQVLNIPSSGYLNNLVTNGIAGIKSVLVVPFINVASCPAGVSPLLSPYDPCGGGTTSPLSHLYNFQVVVSGQNSLYNNQRWTYEAFLQQLNGQNAVNGNVVDGLGSSLISQQDFENSYCYYYVNLERALPIERTVPKSVVIQGQNMSALTMDYFIFVEMSANVALNVILGSRV